MSHTHPFHDKRLALVFAHAPAGLGHLRVTDALYNALPDEADPLLLISSDPHIRWQHYITSNNPIGKNIFEWVQNTPLAETLFTRWYRSSLRRNTKQTAEQIAFILEQKLDEPKKLLVIATHFGLAHEVAALRHTLEKKLGVKIYLVVQVTDDSPQKIWYVPGADLTFVPSQYTADSLTEYGKKEKLKPTTFAVAPYPVSPHLAQVLSSQEQQSRQDQLRPNHRDVIQVSLPVSGAAVGLIYSEVLLETLHKKSKLFRFHITCKSSAYTNLFLARHQKLPYTQINTSSSDREVVEMYEEAYKETVFSLEITKPSEQAFKTLIAPTKRGGVIVLFTQPIGRQEYDNMAFLRRHSLLPSEEMQQRLWELSREELSLKSAEGVRILAQAKNWRSLVLPTNPMEAANFIWWLRQQGVLLSMLACRVKQAKNTEAYELGDDGVHVFWERVGKLLHAPTKK